MNYKEAAREIDIALFRDNRDDLMKMPPGQRRFLIFTKLKELFRIPEDLEATIEIAVRRCAFDLRFYKNGRVDRDKLISEIKGRIIFTVAPFCQKPEVPKDLEAAVRAFFKTYPYDKRTTEKTELGEHFQYYVEITPGLIGGITKAVALFCCKPEVPKDLESAVRGAVHEIWRSEHLASQESFDDYEQSSEDWQARLTPYITTAVGQLLAERDRTLKMQHDSIVRMDKRIKGLERQRASIRLGIHDILRRLERADSTIKCWADKNNIRNCLVGLQKTAAKESPDED